MTDVRRSSHKVVVSHTHTHVLHCTTCAVLSEDNFVIDEIILADVMAHMSPQVCRRHFERPLPQSTAMLKSHDSKTISGFKPPYLRDCTPLPRTVTTSQNHLQPIGPPCRAQALCRDEVVPIQSVSENTHRPRWGCRFRESVTHQHQCRQVAQCGPCFHGPWSFP